MRCTRFGEDVEGHVLRCSVHPSSCTASMAPTSRMIEDRSWEHAKAKTSVRRRISRLESFDRYLGPEVCDVHDGLVKSWVCVLDVVPCRAPARGFAGGSMFVQRLVMPRLVA